MGHCVRNKEEGYVYDYKIVRRLQTRENSNVYSSA